MKRSLSRKDLKKMIRAAHQNGWTVERTGKGHLKWSPPRGNFVITPSSPSDGRSAMNMIAELKRHGLEL